MSFRFLDHPGEVELVVDAAGEPEIYGEALHAFAELVEQDTGGRPGQRHIRLEAPDRVSLLVDWLNELVFRSEVTKVLFTELEITHLSDRQLVAAIRGTRVERLRNPVKAATYHGLSIVERAGGLTATVILDV